MFNHNLFSYCVNNPVRHSDSNGLRKDDASVGPGLTRGEMTAILQGAYLSADKAASGFAKKIYSTSKFIRHEYGTLIY